MSEDNNGCRSCGQFTKEWTVKWGCIGNGVQPDGKLDLSGCEHITKEDQALSRKGLHGMNLPLALYLGSLFAG